MNQLKTYSILAVACGFSSVALPNRDSDTPTGNLIAANRSEAEITQLTDQGYRIIDLEVVNTSPYRFTASLVKNSGSYAQAWWWTADKSGAGLEAFAAERNARPIDVEVNIVNGQRRYAGVFVSNSGSNSKAWWWFDQKSFAEVQTLANQRNARVIDLEKVGSTYTGVMIGNSGNDARVWGMFQAKSAVQIRALLSNQRRMIDIEPVGSELYDGVWEAGETLGWRRFNMTWDQLVEDTKQQGARVTDIERTVVGGQSRYTYVLINNSTPLETRVGEYMRNRTNGRVGFYLARVGGNKIAGLMHNEPFYPASSIKVLQHAFLSHRVGILGLSPTTQVPHYTDSVNDTHPANNSTVAFNLNLAATCQAMMVNSSNQSTNAVQDFAGQNNLGTPNGAIGRNRIDTFKTNQIGLGTSTRIWHKFGNQGPASNPANVTTAVDLTSIYTSALSTPLLGITGRQFFWNNMLTDDSSNSGLNLALRQVINEEAASLGMLAADRNAFRDAMEVAWKGGNWGTAWVSNAGWVKIPFRSESGRIGSRTYVLCGWIDNASNNGISSISIEVLGELMRDEIRTALQSW